MGAGEMFKFEISLAASERHRGLLSTAAQSFVNHRALAPFPAKAKRGFDQLGSISTFLAIGLTPPKRYKLRRNADCANQGYSHLLISFECQRSVAVKFQFVDPITVRQIADSERIHWLNEMQGKKRSYLRRIRRKKRSNSRSEKDKPERESNRCMGAFVVVSRPAAAS
jgi:hypothetical protein